MKKTVLPVLSAIILTGCSTYQYTARSIGVDRQNVGTKEIAVEIVPDYERTVTAVSDFQTTKYDAIAEAEHRCIVENDIDVVVDPIVRIEREPMQPRKKYRATISGFAGTYRAAKAGVDAAKEYEKEDIEKYKLLSDPDFAKYYYSSGTGDIYYINSSEPAAIRKSGPASLAFAPKVRKNPEVKFDFTKSRRLRNAGIGLTAFGVISTFAVGLPLYLNGESYEYSYYGGYYYNNGNYDAGVTLMTIGSAAVAAGIPMWCIGAKRMKNSDRDLNLSVGNTQSGVGLRLNF